MADNRNLWLRDFLPEAVPNARILTYGYDGKTKDSKMLSCQTLHDIALDLVTLLTLHRTKTQVSRLL